MEDNPTDPRTVFVADSRPVAERVIELLAANNIVAEHGTSGPHLEAGLFGATETVPAEAFPVLVTDPKQADEARELLNLAVNKALVQSAQAKRAARTGTVQATCEECGHVSEWPATAMGTTETCPKCGAYMDVPDPDDDWSGVDFGAPEEDNE
jgi:rRNA maturation protein Nop10